MIYRFWYEMFDPGLVLRSGVLEMLAGSARPGRRFSICVATRRGDYTDELVKLAREMGEYGIEFCLWPLLPDEVGYWISVHNAGEFVKELGRIDAWARSHGVEIPTIAVDLEPPYGTKVTPRYFMRTARVWREGISNLERALRAIHDMGARALVPAVDLLLDYDEDVSRLLQFALGTPVDFVDWDIIHPMIYNSMTSGYLHVPLDLLRKRMVLQLMKGRKRYGKRLGVSIGVVWTGKLGNEPVYEDARDIAIDTGIAKAFGIEDIALYNLEGLIFRRDGPEILRALTDSEPFLPSLRGLGLSVYRAVTRVLGAFGKPFIQAFARVF